MADGHINPANVPDIALRDGQSIPQVGLGVLRVDDEGVVPVVESALEAGYRHIDGAAGYDNEAGVGRALAAAHGVSPARVILRWHIENGTIIIPKSVHAARQKENLDLFGFELTAEEHAAIDALDGPTRAGHDPLTFTYA